MTALSLILISATVMLLCIYCMRLREDLHEEKRKRADSERKRVAAETEIAQRDIAARAAQELQERADAEIDADIRRAFKAIEADLNAALRKKPKAKLLQFPTITSGGRVARFDSPPEQAS